LLAIKPILFFEKSEPCGFHSLKLVLCRFPRCRSCRRRTALATLPVLRKSDLPTLHKAVQPFGGFVSKPLGAFARLYITSPGPIFEPEAADADPCAGHGRCSPQAFAPVTWC
jgi:hypothetical protein